MKKSMNQRWQLLVWVSVTAVSLLGASYPALTQDVTYKVGDVAETMSAGKWVKVEIIQVRDDGYYVIRYLDTGISGAWAQAKDFRSVLPAVPTNDQGQGQTNRNTQTKAAGGKATTQKPKTIGQRYGSREPGTCTNTKAPARGAITASLAKKYFSCQAEGVWSENLYLVENITVQVGGGVPYNRNLGAFEAINVRVPLYPIRGSYRKYQCDDLETAHVGPPDTNCTIYNNPKATGYCYKTTFGDWRCSMADRGATNKENVRTKAAPPKR